MSRLSQPSTLSVGRSLPSCGLREVGEADLALVALAVVGDEEQVVRGPGRALGAVGGGALLQRHLARGCGAARQPGSRFGSNLTKKMPQGWLADSGRRRLISSILAAFFGVDAEFLRRVRRRSAPRSRRRDRPVQLVAQVGDELVEASDLGQCGALIGRHRAQPSLSSIQHLSDGFTPTGASTRFR